jgi:hypothetical protein
VTQRGGTAGIFVIGADLADDHHTPHFDFDEGALAKSVLMCGNLSLPQCSCDWTRAKTDMGTHRANLDLSPKLSQHQDTTLHALILFCMSAFPNNDEYTAHHNHSCSRERPHFGGVTPDQPPK